MLRLHVEAEAIDPTTSPRRLAQLASYAAPVGPIARRNGNLPGEVLRCWLGQGDIDAWQNPSTPLLLLERPGRELAYGAATVAIALHKRLGWSKALVERLARGHAPLARRLRERARPSSDAGYRVHLTDDERQLLGLLATALGG